MSKPHEVTMEVARGCGAEGCAPRHSALSPVPSSSPTQPLRLVTHPVPSSAPLVAPLLSLGRPAVLRGRMHSRPRRWCGTVPNTHPPLPPSQPLPEPPLVSRPLAARNGTFVCYTWKPSRSHRRRPRVGGPPRRPPAPRACAARQHRTGVPPSAHLSGDDAPKQKTHTARRGAERRPCLPPTGAAPRPPPRARRCPGALRGGARGRGGAARTVEKGCACLRHTPRRRAARRPRKTAIERGAGGGA